MICPAGHNCTTAAASSVPWQAAIVRRNKWQPYCGGSLINDRDGESDFVSWNLGRGKFTRYYDTVWDRKRLKIFPRISQTIN